MKEELLRKIVQSILKVLSPDKIILFGSRAYREPHKESDFDILVVDGTVSSRYDTRVKLYGALWDIDIPIDIIVAKPSDIEDWKNVPQAPITNITKRGKVIYERKG